MDKKLVFLASLLILSVLIIGCKPSEVPPEPGAPGQVRGDLVGRALDVYRQGFEAYAPGTDIFSNEQILFVNPSIVNLDIPTNEFAVKVDANQKGGFIYRKGFINTRSGWKEFELNGDKVGNSNWLKNSGNTILKLDKNLFNDGQNYVVTYSCKKQDAEWKCGCRDPNKCNLWMLEGFVLRNVETPPEPIPPGSLINTLAYVWPNQQIFKHGQEIYPGAHIESTQDILKTITGTDLVLIKPDSQRVSLNLYLPESRCEEESRFACYTSGSTSYIADQLGEYEISLNIAYSDQDQYSKTLINPGKFRVVDPSVFTNNLIENNIGSFAFTSSDGGYGEDRQQFGASYSIQVPGVYVNANVLEDLTPDKWILRYHLDYGTGYSQKIDINVNGVNYQIFLNDISEFQRSFGWSSGSKYITINFHKNDKGYIVDEQAILNAYLSKFPSDLGVEKVECTDSDSGRNYYVKGVVVGGGSEYLDRCALGRGEAYNDDPNMLFESYCFEDGTGYGYDYYSCPNGCQDGACIADTAGTVDLIGISTSTNILELTENIGSVRPLITGVDLSGLAAQTIMNARGTTTVNQVIRLDNKILTQIGNSGSVKFTEDEDDNVGAFLFYSDADDIFELELEFVGGWQSDISGMGELEDLMGNILTIIGEEFTVTDAQLTTGQSLILTLASGTNFIRLGDTFTDDTFNSAGVIVNDESIEDARVKIKATVANNILTISNIKYRLASDGRSGDVYIPPGGRLRNQLDEPAGLFSPKFDILYSGFDSGETTDISITANGPDQYMLQFTNNGNLQYKIEFVTNKNGIFKYGDDDQALRFMEGGEDIVIPIKRRDWFVLTNNGFTNILKYDSIDTLNNKITFTDLAGGTKEIVYTDTTNACGSNFGRTFQTGDLIVSGNTYKVILDESLGPTPQIGVDLNGDGDCVSRDEVNIVTKGGAIIDLGEQDEEDSKPAGTSISLQIKTLAEKINSNQEETFDIIIVPAAGNEVDLDVPDNPSFGLSMRSLPGNTNERQGMTRYGAFIREIQAINDPDDAVIKYPLQQVEHKVFVELAR